MSNSKDPFSIIPFSNEGPIEKIEQKRNLNLKYEGKFIIIEWKGKKTIIDFHKSVEKIREEIKKAVFALEGIELIENKEDRRRKEAWLEREIYGTLFDFISDLNAKGVFLEVEENIIYTPFLVLNDGRIAEEGFDGKEVYYIVYDPKTEKIEKMKRIEQDGKIYLPIFNDDVKNYQVLLPSWPEEYGSEEQLIKEIREYLDRWHEQREENERKIDIAYCLITYIYDLLPNLPYRRALGEAGGGKSTWLETLGSICYRPMFLAGCDSEASLRRTFDLWRGTAIIDEADFHNSSLYSIITKILNIGYSKSQGWYRCCDDKDPSKILAFYVYGPKLLATRRSFDDIALESRCLTFHSFENITPKPLFRMDNFRNEALKLRNKLLLWRLRNYHKFKEKIAKLEDTNFLQELFKDVDVKSRIKQILTPLSLISEELKNGIVSLAKELSEELRALDKDIEFEAQIRRAIEKIAGEAGESGDIYGAPTPAYRIRLKDIAQKILEEEGEKIDSSSIRKFSRSLGAFFREKLGFKTRVEGHEKVTYVYIPREWLLREGAYSVSAIFRSSRKIDIPFKAICEICGQEAIIEEIIEGRYVCSKCAKEEKERLKTLSQERISERPPVSEKLGKSGNWGNSGNDQNKICENCKHYNKDASFCLLTNTLTTPTSTCDNWTLKETKQEEKQEKTKSQESLSQKSNKESKSQEPGLTCADCKHHITSNNKCLKHLEWAFVSPFHLVCEFFEKRDDKN